MKNFSTKVFLCFFSTLVMIFQFNFTSNAQEGCPCHALMPTPVASKHNPAFHAPNPLQTDNPTCNICHKQTNLAEVHSAYNWDCLSCHQGTGPKYGSTAVSVINAYKAIPAPTDNDKAGCQNCHSTVTGTKGNPASLENNNHIILHDPNPRISENADCNICHAKTDLANIHNMNCELCHNGIGPKYGSTAVQIINAYRALPNPQYANKAGCQDCHPNVTAVKGVPSSLVNNNHKVLHDPNPRQAENATCKLCHNQGNLPDVHLAYNKNCLACHNNDSTALGQIAKQVIAAYGISGKTYADKAGCQTCHTTVTGTKGDDASLANSEHLALHDPNPRQVNNDFCKSCHTQNNLPEIHSAFNKNCSACHNNDTTALGQLARQVIDAYMLTGKTYNDKAGCQTCHTTTVSGTKGVDSSLINNDHLTLHDPNPRQAESGCKSCHAQTTLPEVHSAYNLDCVNCHNNDTTALGQTAKQVIAAFALSGKSYNDKAGCQTCHTTVTAVKNDPSSLYNSDHSLLHDTNPRVSESSLCSSCHTERYLDKIHNTYGWDCAGCHSGSGPKYGSTSVVIINAYKTSGKTYNDKAGCPDCHPTVTGAKNVPASLKNNEHIILHDPNPRIVENPVCILCHNSPGLSKECNICHTDVNLAAVHSYNCVKCHMGTGPNYGSTAVQVIKAYDSSNKTYADKAGCQSCHPTVTGAKGEPLSLTNINHVALHEPNPRQYNNDACKACHTQVNLPDLHTEYNKNCLACHEDTTTVLGQTAKQVIASYSLSGKTYNDKAGCQTCHTTTVTGTKGIDSSLVNSGHLTLHDPNPKNYVFTVCKECHSQTNLPAIHAASNVNCLACHSPSAPAPVILAINKYSSDKVIGNKASCNDCHTTVSLDSANALNNSTHITLHDPNPRQAENATCNLCHNQTNLPEIHSASNWDCFSCHKGTGPEYGAAALLIINAYSAKTNPTYADNAGCQDCHPTVTGTKGNPSTLANGNHKTLHDPNPRQYNNDLCKMCHTQTNLADVHSASNYNCLACHNGTGPVLGTKAQQVIAAYDSIQNPTYNDKAGCQTCHATVAGTIGNDSSLANSAHIALHVVPNDTTSSACAACHNTTKTLPDLHIKIADSCLGCHAGTGPKYGSTAVQAILDYKATGKKAGCTTCHGQQNHTCVTCHTDQKNARRPVTPEFGLSSHHVAGSVTPDDCLDCHNVDNHGSGTVYLKNLDNTTDVIAYDPNNAVSLNPFCLGCHDADSKTSTPFSDGKKPVSSGKNWDSTDIDTKYSNTGTADSNKYPPTTTAPGNTLKFNTVPNEKKAYSPHGNPAANQPNGNTSDKPVACYDCHNSHGSSLPALIKTTDTYTPASVEDFCWGCHLNETNAPNKASEYLLDPENNEVRDYYGDKRWGENSGTGFKGDWMSAFTYKSGKFMSSHFYPSKKYDSLKAWQRSAITCTNCHDPHGINSALVNAKYMVPVLKGTWLVSPYKEDRAPEVSYVSSMPDDVRTGEEGGNKSNYIRPRSRPGLDFNNPPNPGAGYANGTGGTGHEGYFIDENTFGASGSGTITVNRMSENDTTFAGLCLGCHTKTALKAAWSGHGVVKGWGGASKDIFTSSISKTTMAGGEEGGGNYRWGVNLRSQDSNGYIQTDYHQFACSKCHSPHASRLKRLMVTNCLDNEGNHSPMSNDLATNANNCHSTQRGNGWDTTIPWVQTAAPVTSATVDNATITPNITNMLVSGTAKLTFAAKNNKAYTLDFFMATFDINYTGLDISNLICNPPARIAAYDSTTGSITLKWENINPGYAMTASFDCKSSFAGYYQIINNTVEYQDNLGNIVAGNCNDASINIVYVIDTSKPSVPTNLKGTALSSSQIKLTWTKATDNIGVTGYNIYRGGVLVGTAGDDTTYTDQGLNGGTAYTYKISAFDLSGNTSNQTAQISVSTPTDTIAPSVPANLHSTGVTRTSIKLEWDASTDNVAVTGYKIYRNGTQIGTSTTPSYTISTGLSSNTIYRIKVSAYDARGNTSSATAEINVKTGL